MHIAYYLLRGDGDGELFAAFPVDDDFFSHPESSKELQQFVEQQIDKLGYWFKVRDTECDFPDIWDLTSPDTRAYLFPN